MTTRRALTESQRLDILMNDVQSHAKTISIFAEELRDTKTVLQQLATDKAVRAVVDKNLDERLERIEESIKQLTTSVDRKFAPYLSAGKAIGIVAAGVLVSALVRWLLSGVLTP